MVHVLIQADIHRVGCAKSSAAEWRWRSIAAMAWWQSEQLAEGSGRQAGSLWV